MRAAAEPRASRRAAAPAAFVLVALAACAGPGITPIRTAFNKGVYHHSRGELDAAIAEYREALADDPGDQRARFNLASAYDEQGRAHRDAGDAGAAAADLAEAERQYREVLRRDPTAVRASVNLAALEYERGDAAAGRQRLEHAIAEHPDLALPRTALALRMLQEGELESARALLQQALAAEPADLGANLLQGEVCARLGQLDDARAAYEAALRRQPDDPGALVALARLEEQTGHESEALVLLRQAVLGHGRNLEARLLLADLYERRGELEDAVYQLWQARDLDPRKVSPVDYRARLRALYGRLLAGLDAHPAEPAPEQRQPIQPPAHSK